MATGSGGAYHNGGNGGASAAIPYVRGVQLVVVYPTSIYRTTTGEVIPTTFIPGEGKPDGQMLSHSDPSHFLVDSNGNKI